MYSKDSIFDLSSLEKLDFSCEDHVFLDLETTFDEVEDNVGLWRPKKAKNSKKGRNNMLNFVRDLIRPVAFVVAKTVRESLQRQCLYIEQTGAIANFEEEIEKRRQRVLEHEKLLSNVELPLSEVREGIHKIQREIQNLEKARRQLLTLSPNKTTQDKEGRLNELEGEKQKQLEQLSQLVQSVERARNKKRLLEERVVQFPELREKHTLLQRLIDKKEERLCELLTERNRLNEERAIVRSPKYGPRCRCSHGLWKVYLEADVEKWEGLKNRFEGLSLKNTSGLGERIVKMTDGLEDEISKAIYLALRSEMGMERFEYMGRVAQEEYIGDALDAVLSPFEFYPFCHLNYKVENSEIDMSQVTVENVHKMFFEMLKWHVKNMAKGVVWKVNVKAGCLCPLNENDEEGVPTEERSVRLSVEENGIYARPWESLSSSDSSSVVDAWERVEQKLGPGEMAEEAYKRCLISYPLPFGLIPRKTALGELGGIVTRMARLYGHSLLEHGNVRGVLQDLGAVEALLTQSEKQGVSAIVSSVFDEHVLSIIGQSV